jgi:hypothetical protein
MHIQQGCGDTRWRGSGGSVPVSLVLQAAGRPSPLLGAAARTGRLERAVEPRGVVLPLLEVGRPPALAHEEEDHPGDAGDREERRKHQQRGGPPGHLLAGDVGGEGVAVVVLAVDAEKVVGALALEAVVAAAAVVLAGCVGGRGLVDWCGVGSLRGGEAFGLDHTRRTGRHSRRCRPGRCRSARRRALSSPCRTCPACTP